MKNKLFIFIALIIIPLTLYASDGNGHEISTLIWRALTFLIFMWLLYKFIKTPLIDFINNRVNGIKKRLLDLNKENNELRKEFDSADKMLKNVDEEINELKVKFSKTIEQEKKAILKEGERQLEKLRKLTEKAIELEIRKAEKKLINQIIQKSIEQSKRDLSGKLDGKMHSQINLNRVERISEYEI